MDNANRPSFERDLDASLSRGREVPVVGFAERVVTAVRADRHRRKLIRWSSFATAAAACVVTILLVQSPSEETLNRQTVALVAREESTQLADLLGIVDDLSLLAPVAEKSSIVDVLATPGS
ncbi:MAG: hypothetical protein WCJ96_05675 [Verrucomicrobiota bacterium]|jgi:hypothetical protein